jgi:hypothetical protein
MLDLLNKSETETETAIDTATKRELIETELRTDPNRSDRKIASVVGCDHKTVGAARDRMGIATPLAGNISPSISPLPPAMVKEPEYDPFDPKSEDLVIPHQPAIAVYENTSGAVVIIQCASQYDEMDPVILVRPENLDALIVSLRKFLP